MDSQTSPEELDWRAAFTPARFAGFLALCLFAAYPDVLLGLYSLFYRDFGLFTYPVAHQMRETLWRGELPLWNPLSNCGIPFLAQWNTSVCYPPSLFYVAFPLPWSLNFLCFGHLLLAGCGMYALVFRWTGDRFAAAVGGCLYALNGFAFNNLMWVSNLAAMSWLPLVLFSAECAWQRGGTCVIWAALCGAMQMLSGAPEFILATWAIVFMLWTGKLPRADISRRLLILRMVISTVLVAGLSAVQLLPFLELLRHSDRSVNPLNDAWSLPGWGWANFFVPLFRCSPGLLGVYSQTDQQWTSSYYISIITLPLAGYACWQSRSMRVWWLAVVAAVGLGLAMGRNSFLYNGLQTILPVCGWVRYPVKYLVFTVFALPALAAFGVCRWRRASESGSRFVSRRLIAVTGLVLLVILGVCAFAFLSPGAGEKREITLQNGAARAGWLVATCVLMVFLKRRSVARFRIGLAWGFLLLTGADMLTHAPRQNPSIPCQAYAPLPPDLSPPRFGEARAMISPTAQALLGCAATPNPVDYHRGTRQALYGNCNLIEAVPKVNGFFSLYLQREAAIRARIYTPTNFPTGLLDFLGVSQISADDSLFEWERRVSHHPLMTGGQRPVFAADADILDAVCRPGFDARATVYLPLEAAKVALAMHPSPVTIHPVSITAHRLAARVEATTPAWVVIAQCAYPAWRAEVNGQPVRLWHANYAYQALEVPAGRSEVKVVYRNNAFRLGAGISGATLVGCVVGWACSRRAEMRRRRGLDIAG